MGTLTERAEWHVEVLPLLLRTTAQTVDLVKPAGATGVYVTVNATVEDLSVVMSPSILLPTFGSTPVYESILTAAVDISAIGVYTYLVYPGAAAAAQDVTESVSFPLPSRWRFQMLVGDTDAMTYEVWAAYV